MGARPVTALGGRTLALPLLLAGALALAGPAAGQDGVPVPPEAPPADFNGDGYGDLAVGVPNEEVLGVYYAGAVNVAYGGPDGLTSEGDQLITQAGDVYGSPQTGAAFGRALAAGDFNFDRYDDLAVGAPLWDEPRLRDAGLVVVLWGSAEGLVPDPGSFRFLFARGARYGSALAAGQFDRWAPDDLAVGAPGWTDWARDVPEAGGVEVLYGSRRSGLGRGQWWSQGTPGVADWPDAEDHFGAALAAGQFGSGPQEEGADQDDLAIGVPGERVPLYRGADRAGVVHVLYGGDEGLTADGAQLFSQWTRGIGSDPEEDDAFGSALAAGRFGQGVGEALVIGAPGESDDRCAGSCPRAGVVHVLYPGEGGLSGRGSDIFRPPWTWDPTDFEYGAALAVGDFGGDDEDDLAVGAPFWRSSEGELLGRVHFLFERLGRGARGRAPPRALAALEAGAHGLRAGPRRRRLRRKRRRRPGRRGPRLRRLPEARAAPRRRRRRRLRLLRRAG